ncbi:MAG: TRAP transporter small permease [Burkholderiaceae bacterium]
MRKFLDAVFEYSGRLAALCILTIFVLMIYVSMGRTLGWRVGAINDAVAWFCASASFLAMAHAFKHGDFVRVTLLLEAMGPRLRRWFESGSLLIAAVAVSYLAWWAARFTYESWEFKDIASGMIAIPIWIPQMSFVAGSVLLLVAVLDELVIVLRGGKPTYVRMVEERHARGDFSEDI